MLVEFSLSELQLLVFQLKFLLFHLKLFFLDGQLVEKRIFFDQLVAELCDLFVLFVDDSAERVVLSG